MRKPGTPSIVSIAILTVLTLVLWITLGVVRLLGEAPEAEVTSETLEALSPELNTQTLVNLQSRIYFEESEIGETNFVTEVVEETPEEETIEENLEEESLETGEETTASPSGSVESEEQ